MSLANSRRPAALASPRVLGFDLAALVTDRVELFALEWQEERARARKQLALVLQAALFLGMGMLLAAFLVIVLCWDTHPLAATAGVTLLYLAIGLGGLTGLWKMRHESPPFAATLSEFSEDLGLLRGHGD